MARVRSGIPHFSFTSEEAVAKVRDALVIHDGSPSKVLDQQMLDLFRDEERTFLYPELEGLSPTGSVDAVMKIIDLHVGKWHIVSDIIPHPDMGSVYQISGRRTDSNIAAITGGHSLPHALCMILMAILTEEVPRSPTVSH